MSDDGIVEMVRSMMGITMLMVSMVMILSIVGLLIGGSGFVGFDQGSGEQIGYISEVESNGIFWRPVEIRLISIEPTFSNSDTVWYYGSPSTEITEKAMRCLKNHAKVTVKYETFQYVEPWSYSHRTLIKEIIGEC